MRNLLILFFSLFHFSLFSQEVVNLRFDNIDIKDSIEIVIWEMDWDNKLVSDRPIYKSIIGFNSVIFFYPGHYNISYTNGTFIYYMFNLHIKSDLSYYRYTIKSGDFCDFTLNDSFFIRKVIADF